MNARWTAADRYHPALLAMTGLTALLLAGVASCTGDLATPTPASSQPAGPTPSSSAQAEPTPFKTAESDVAGTDAPNDTPVAVDDALIERARTEGTVSVIVTLDIPYRPEAELAGQAEIEAQRAAIAAAQDELAASIPSATVTTRMTLFPQIVLSVDEGGLRQLASSPLVLAINANDLSAPTS